MPNGGVPMNMILEPHDGSPFVIHVRGSVIRVHARADWETAKAQSKPVLQLDEEEGLVLASFLSYWLGDRVRPGIRPVRGVRAEYDYRALQLQQAHQPWSWYRLKSALSPL